MDRNDFIPNMQKFTSISAVGVSALRGQGVGVLKKTQEYLGELDLSILKDINTHEDIISWLDKQTEKILDCMPLMNRPWGAARKALNLFLRDCLYNKYLCQEYKMERLENWLEIPLDSLVAKGLREKAEKGLLPKWPGLKHLKKKISDQYQDIAQSFADINEIARVHMDVALWLENRR
ncbi:MAG: hypothetical protein HY753_06920 [Nitrospirae bacterium]|nr:hypothetical protein [Nitrospirota bacterium]